MPARIDGNHARILASVLTGVFGISVLSANAVSAADELAAALTECAGIANDSDRLKCFDAVAGKSGGKPPISEPDVAQAAAVPLTDDVGRERVKGAEKEKSPEYAAIVTRCERHPQSEQLYFYLENGQVWKQSNNRRLNYRKCQFEVTLSKDTFGYKLYIPSKDRNVRVTRLR